MARSCNRWAYSEKLTVHHSQLVWKDTFRLIYTELRSHPLRALSHILFCSSFIFSSKYKIHFTLIYPRSQSHNFNFRCSFSLWFNFVYFFTFLFCFVFSFSRLVSLMICVCLMFVFHRLVNKMVCFIVSNNFSVFHLVLVSRVWLSAVE